jgi:hypothetical protein
VHFYNEGMGECSARLVLSTACKSMRMQCDLLIVVPNKES